ncbi:hypothetical protein TWF730_008374 [Orbilia blumenaviensis]|uniref:Uncharacterized protein n=1 Tax=Orbilia blumenaviensis TaxID=1796055 RepID=A0AAV9V2W6_9PEZI
MFSKSISILFSLLALVSIATALPFNPRLENTNALKRNTCNVDTLLLLLRAQGALGEAMCRNYLKDSETPEPTTGGTSTVVIATERPTITLTRSLVNDKTVYSTITLAPVTNTKSYTVTSTTTVTSIKTIVQLKARRDRIEKKSATKVNILEPFANHPGRVSSACSCILTITPQPVASPTATVSVTATEPVYVDTMVFVANTFTSTITVSAATVETKVTSTVVKTETTVVYTREWVQ